MNGSILRDILDIFNECTIDVTITEPMFLDMLYPQKIKYAESENAKKKMITGIFSGNASKENKGLLLNSSIKNRIQIAFDEWRIDEEKLEFKIENYINTTLYFDESQKKSLLQKNKFEVRLIDLIHAGIEGADVNFNKYIIKQRFIGREKDLEELEKILQEHSLCYLYGVNGLGKTTLVREYARMKQSNYIELKYSESLKKTLDRSSNFKKQKAYDEVLKKLDESVLLVIDDIDENYYEDEYFEILNHLKCKVVLVFYHEPDVQFDINGNDKKLKIKELSIEHLEELFRYSVHAKKKDDRDIIAEDEVKRLIQNVYQNTYFVILCANLIKNKRCSVKKLNEDLIKSIIEVDNETKLRTEIYQGQKTYNQLASVLYNISGICGVEKELLYVLSNFRNWGINRLILEKLWSVDDYSVINLLNLLIEKGWIDEYGNNVVLYAIPAEYVKNELNHKQAEKSDISNRLLNNAMKVVSESETLNQNLSLGWIFVLYDIVSSCEVKNDKQAALLIDTFELLLGEYPEISYLESLLKRLEEYDTDGLWKHFYTEHFQNMILCMKDNEDAAREQEAELLSGLIKREKEILEKDDEKQWCKITSYQMSCYKFIRDTIKTTINKQNVTDEFIMQVEEFNDMETKWSSRIYYVCGKYPELKNMITGYTTYFVNYYLYCLQWLDLTDEERMPLLDYLESEGVGLDVQVEIHKVKSRIAKIKGNYVEAKKEICSAIEIVDQLDSPLYYMECILAKLDLEIDMGCDKKQLLEQVEQLEKEFVYRNNDLTQFFSVKNGIDLLKRRCSDVPNE